MSKPKTINSLIERLARLENIEKTCNAQIKVLDEYRTEMNDLRYKNDRLKKAIVFLRGAAKTLRNMNRRKRILNMNVA